MPGVLHILYGGCKGCSVCYGFNEGTSYLSPAEYDPKSRTVFLRCAIKERLEELAYIINHEVLHDIIHCLEESCGIIDVFNVDLQGGECLHEIE